MATGLILEEKRQLVRRELIYYLPVSDQATGQEVGRLADINRNGLLLIAPKHLEPNREYRLTLEMPKTLKEEGFRALKFKAQALWNGPGLNMNSRETGCKFNDLSPDAAGVIDRLIEYCVMP